MAQLLHSKIASVGHSEVAAALAVELTCELKKKNYCFSRSIPYPSCESPIYLELLWVEFVGRKIWLVPNAGESVGEPYG